MVRQFSDSISLKNIIVWHKICKLTDMIHHTHNIRVYFGKETGNDTRTQPVGWKDSTYVVCGQFLLLSFFI
jgi:hypothetical protein